MTCTLANRRPGIKTDFQTKGRKSKYRIQNTLFITEGITLPPASHLSLGGGGQRGGGGGGGVLYIKTENTAYALTKLLTCPQYACSCPRLVLQVFSTQNPKIAID